MPDFIEIVNMHTHLVRDLQQEKQVYPEPGWPDSWYVGSPDRMIPDMNANGVSYIATMNVMDTPRMVEARIRRARQQGASEDEIAKARVDLREDMRQRVRDLNDWSIAAQNAEPRLITYMMIDPVLFGEQTLDEFERCVEMGAKGVKVHPDIYGHHPDHALMMQVYERCQELGLGVLSDSRNEEFGQPLGWIPVLKAFPRLKFIMAHLVDEMWDDRIDLARQFGDNLWFDMSTGLVDDHHPAGGHACLPMSQAVRVFRKVGVERIMYGSDGRPGGDALYGARQVVALPFTDAEKEMILSGNAKRFFNLPDFDWSSVGR
ncbi:MAG: amidohydrolase family protein [Dehalococcoidia bacterium]